MSRQAVRPRCAPIAFALLFAAGTVGCGGVHIPNTEVPDTAANRDVIEFCERYRRAIEQRDVVILASLASPRYFENAGTPQGEDDYDTTGLRRLLGEFGERVRSVRYDVRYRRIRQQGARTFVEFTYSASFLLATPAGERWYRRVADNQLELERVGERWKILAGM